MARFNKSSAESPSTDAALAARKRAAAKKAPSIEDTMFFPRLRRHAKWMFVFLALVFGVGFVAFGVGAGGVGVGDVLRDRGGASAESVKDAAKKTVDQPRNAAAWRDLSTALQTEGETDDAVAALVTAVSLAPKDADLHRELAGLYLTQATEKQNDAQVAQVGAAFTGASWNLPGALTSKDGTTVLPDPIGQAVNAVASQTTQKALLAAGEAARNAVAAYREVAALQPDDPNVQLELASTAEQAGDGLSAIAAYERFLELAPDDPNAVIVKQQVKQLRAAAAASAG